jgi:hypothetical protein
MRTLTPAILTLSIFAILASSIAIANAGPKRSREACMQLARERGFTAGDRAAGQVFRSFVIACMQGKQN